MAGTLLKRGHARSGGSTVVYLVEDTHGVCIPVDGGRTVAGGEGDRGTENLSQNDEKGLPRAESSAVANRFGIGSESLAGQFGTSALSALAQIIHKPGIS